MLMIVVSRALSPFLAGCHFVKTAVDVNFAKTNFVPGAKQHSADHPPRAQFLGSLS